MPEMQSNNVKRIEGKEWPNLRILPMGDLVNADDSCLMDFITFLCPEGVNEIGIGRFISGPGLNMCFCGVLGSLF